MSAEFERSIFAVTLTDVLAPFGMTITSLRRTPFNFEKEKIERLAESLESIKFMPALNHEELITLTTFVKIERKQRLLLYAAFIALGSQRHLLNSFLAPQRAYMIATEVRDAAHTWLLTNSSEDDFLRLPANRVAASDAPQPGFQAVGGTLLAKALDVYDEGMALQTAGVLFDQRDSLIAADACYAHALRLLESLPPAAQATETWQFWRHEIAQQHDQLE